MPRLHPAVDHARRARQRQRGLRYVIPWLCQNSGLELLPLLRCALRSNQHSVTARFPHRFHDQLLQILKRIFSLRIIAHQISWHIRQDGFFAQIKFDDLRNVRVHRFVIRYARSDRIGQRHISRSIRIKKSRHAQNRIRPEAQRIQKIIIHPAVNHIHSPKPRCRPHVHDVVVHQQVAPFHQLDAHLLRQKRVFEISRVRNSGRQENRGGVLPVIAILRRQAAQRRQQRLRIVIHRPHTVIPEHRWKNALQHLAVRQHVRNTARHP